MTQNQFTDLQLKWLEALESGEYRQTKQNLCHDRAFCCLGVATSIHDPGHYAISGNGWRHEDYEDELDMSKDVVMSEYGEDGATAPPDVVDALGISGSTGNFRFGSTFHIEGNPYRMESLVALNDKAEWTFPEIAAFIREKPWLVFTNFDQPAEAAQ